MNELDAIKLLKEALSKGFNWNALNFEDHGLVLEAVRIIEVFVEKSQDEEKAKKKEKNDK